MLSKLRESNSACKPSPKSISFLTHLEGGEKKTDLSIRIDLQPRRTRIQSRRFGDIVVLPLAFFLLELEGDAADGTALDAFHEMGGEAGYFVAETFGGDHCLFGWIGE